MAVKNNYSDEFRKLAVNEYCALLDKGFDTISARKSISEKYNVHYDTLSDWCVIAGLLERKPRPRIVPESKTTTSRPLEEDPIEEPVEEKNGLYVHEVLGKKAKDEITGFVGTITGYAKFLTNVDRTLLEGVDTTGRPIEAWVDSERIVFIEEGE